MSDQLKLVITRKGLDECISAKSKGINLNLKWVSAGDRDYTPNPDQTTLVNEIQRVEFGEYKDQGNNQLQAVGKFSGPQEYPIKELGFWLETGTLLGVISAPNTTLNYKAKDGHCIQPITLDLSALPSDTVTVVVGTENINILIDTEFAIMAKTQVNAMHIGINHEYRLLELENNEKAYDKQTSAQLFLKKRGTAANTTLFNGKKPSDFATKRELDDTSQILSSVITQLTAAFEDGANLIKGE